MASRLGLKFALGPGGAANSPHISAARADKELRDYPLVRRLLGDWIRQRASEPDGLMNDLVRSAFGGSAYLVRWESRLGSLPNEVLTPKDFRKRFQLPDPRKELGVAFDDQLDDHWAELTAVHALSTTSVPVTIRFPRVGQGRSPDFEATWSGRSAFVEVKRVRGFARELRWVYSALEAARILHPDVDFPGVDIWAPDSYHLERLGGPATAKQLASLRDHVTELLTRDTYLEVKSILLTGMTVSIAPGALMMSPKATSKGISIRPFASNADGGLANAMGSLKGVADVMLRVRSALEQLFATRDPTNAAHYLIAYVYFDSWELGGLQLSVLADAFGEILQWNQRVGIIVADGGDDHFYFGRNSKGVMGAETHFKRWADYLST